LVAGAGAAGAVVTGAGPSVLRAAASDSALEPGGRGRMRGRKAGNGRTPRSQRHTARCRAAVM